MAGGGNRESSSSKPTEIIQKLREAESRTRDQQFLAKVDSSLDRLLTKANRIDDKGLAKKIEEVQKCLRKHFAESFKLQFGGSVAKHTTVDGLSDVDILVVFSENADIISPKQSLTAIEKALRECGYDKVKIGRLAATLLSSNYEIQLLPAIKIGGKLKFSDEEGQGWIDIDPKKFASLLSDTNKKNFFKVIPIIKLVKSILSNLPAQHKIKSYHIEALAIEIFKRAQPLPDPKGMLELFFDKARGMILSPIKDITGQSQYVDEYLGGNGSLERLILHDALDRIYRRIVNANATNSTTEWESIVGVDLFSSK